MVDTTIINLAVSLVGGLGIGSLGTTLIKDRLDRNQVRYREKLNIYFGYLEALQNSVIESSQENRQKVVYWHLKLKLVAPKRIMTLAADFYTQDADFHALREQIVDEMRKDLQRV